MKQLMICLKIIFVPLSMAGHGSNALASELPHFKKHENYANVRIKMMKAGWKPYHAKDADTCMTDDARCQGRPEMESCASTGMANCRFLWVKESKISAICTVGEDALFDNVCLKP